MKFPVVFLVVATCVQPPCLVARSAVRGSKAIFTKMTTDSQDGWAASVRGVTGKLNEKINLATVRDLIVLVNSATSVGTNKSQKIVEVWMDALLNEVSNAQRHLIELQNKSKVLLVSSAFGMMYELLDGVKRDIAACKKNAVSRFARMNTKAHDKIAEAANLIDAALTGLQEEVINFTNEVDSMSSLLTSLISKGRISFRHKDVHNTHLAGRVLSLIPNLHF